MIRERHIERDRELPRNRQEETLREIATYRLIGLDDLAKSRYAGDEKAMRRDIAAMGSDVQIRRVMDRRLDRVLEVVTIRGHKARMKEMVHDAGVYPAALDSIWRIERKGGTVLNIVTDDTLKGWKAGRENKATAARGENSPLGRIEKEAIARELHLTVDAKGRTLIPDIRIVYRDKDGQERHQDIEVVSPTYKAHERASKAAAGFSMYGGTHAGSPVRDEESLWR